LEVYSVKIKGVKPLLMHAPNLESERKLRRGEIPGPKSEAEGYLYKDAKGNIVVPSVNIKACIREAGRNYRVSGRRTTFAAMIRAGLDITPYPYVPLIHPQTGLPYLATPDPTIPRHGWPNPTLPDHTKPGHVTGIDSKSSDIKAYPTWQVDIRPVVIQRSRILRARPRFDEWELEFEVINKEPTMIPQERLELILKDAGKHYGLGDFRPEFGLFEVEKFVKVR
jgi:hypothetical protein